MLFLSHKILLRLFFLLAVVVQREFLILYAQISVYICDITSSTYFSIHHPDIYNSGNTLGACSNDNRHNIITICRIVISTCYIRNFIFDNYDLANPLWYMLH